MRNRRPGVSTKPLIWFDDLLLLFAISVIITFAADGGSEEEEEIQSRPRFGNTFHWLLSLTEQIVVTMVGNV